MNDAITYFAGYCELFNFFIRFLHRQKQTEKLFLSTVKGLKSAGLSEELFNESFSPAVNTLISTTQSSGFFFIQFGENKNFRSFWCFNCAAIYCGDSSRKEFHVSVQLGSEIARVQLFRCQN
jgi:hypothetical protein